MSEAPRKEIPRPKGDDDFEDLILALFRVVWQDSGAKLNGRRGQRQHGVDLYGTDHLGGSRLTGVQCKQHASSTVVPNSDLLAELRDSVKQAKSFAPPLQRFVLATTAKRSASVQKEARKITVRHQKKGLFAVDVLAWEDIEDLLRRYPEVLTWYLGDRLPDLYGPWNEIAGFRPPREWERPFVGRRFLRDTVAKYLRANDRGFLLVTGPPGIGKTRFVEHLAAGLPSELSELTGPPVLTFYFWRADRRTTPPGQCLKTLYYTLGRKHSLFARQASDVPETVANQLTHLLEQLSREELAGTGRKEVLILDGLDESEDPARALQLLPKELPEGIFFLLFSRPGAHTEGFGALPGAVRTEIDPISPDNLADAVQLLRLELPHLSPSAAEAVALALRGNFLVLTLFVRHAQARELRSQEALEAARGLGGTEDLQETYAAFWRYLQEDLARRTPADADATLELVGLLSALFEPVTREQACRFLGEGWSGARLDRLLGSIRPFVEVRRQSRGSDQPGHETLELFHDTFDQFVQERLRPDLPGFHERVVRSYVGTGSVLGRPSRLDDYGLRHLIRHALAASPRRALHLLTPELVRHKRQVLGSAAPVLEDLELGIEAAVQERDLASAVLFGLVKGRLQEAESRGTTAAELLLRIRLGEEELAWAKMELLSPDAQFMVAAEIALRHPEGEEPRSLELASRTEALALAAAPEVVEEVALRLAPNHPSLALRLAAHIPEPEDVSGNLEKPTPGRCLVRLFGRLTCSRRDDALRIAAQLAKEERVYALFAIADALLGQDPGRAFAVLDEILASAEDEEQRSVFLGQTVQHLLLRLPDLGTPARGETLLQLLARFPWKASTWDLAFYTEEWLDSAPEEWKALLIGQPPAPARDFLRWRLADKRHLPPSRPEELEAIGLRDLALADQIAQAAKEDPAGAAALVRKAPWQWTAAPLRAAARVAETLWSRDAEKASVLCFVALASKAADPDEIDFGGFLDVLRTAVLHPRPLRARMIREAFELADRLNTLRTPARIALARVLAQAVARAGTESIALFRSLLAEQEEETWRLRIGSGILYNLPAEAVPPLAVSLEESSRFTVPGENTLESDTQGRFLGILASRLRESDPEHAIRLLVLAADLCGTVKEDEGEVFRTRLLLIRTALQLRPSVVWQVYPRCGGSEYTVKIELEHLLNEQLGIAEDERLRVLRLGLDVHFLLRKPKDLERLHQIIERNGVRGGRLLSEEIHVKTKWRATLAWFEALPELIAGYLRTFSHERHFELRLMEIHSFLLQLARQYWDVVFRILQDPVTKRAAEGFYASSLDRAAFAFLAEDPSIQILDLGMLPRRGGEKEAAVETRIRPTLLAAAAAFSPYSFLPLFDRTPGEQALAFASHLVDFDPELSWPPGQLHAVLDRVEATPDPREGLVATTRLAVWLDGKSAPEPGVVARIKEVALAREGTYHLHKIAGHLSGPDPETARALQTEALRRSIAADDIRACLTLLEDGPALEAEAQGAALRFLGEVPNEKTDDWLLGRIATWQASLDPEAALQTISRISPDRDKVSELLGLLSRTVELRDESDIQTWVSRMEALENPSPYQKQRFTERLFDRAIELGIVRSPEIIRGVANLNDRISLLLKLAPRMDPQERDEIFAEAEALAGEIDNVFSQFWACRTLSRFAREAGRPQRQAQLLLRLLKLIRLGGEVSLLRFAEEEVLLFLLATPPSEFEDITALLWEIAGQLSEEPRNYRNPYLQASLLARTAATWFCGNRAKGKELLVGLMEKFRDNVRDVFSGVAEICTLLVLFEKAPEAEAMARDFLVLVPADRQADAADALVADLRKKTESEKGENRYPGRRGLYLNITASPERLGLIQKLLRFCSARMRLEVGFELAILRGYEDPEAGRSALTAVLRDPAWEFPPWRLGLEARPWLACVAVLSNEGAVRAVQDLSREPDALRSQLGDLLAWALLGSDSRRDLLYELWTTAEAFESYIR